LFEAVDSEFSDQKTSSDDNVKTIQKNITDIINKVLEAATAAIDEGDKEKNRKQFAEAIQCYERVPQILSVITEDETTTHGKDKLDLINMAKSNIDAARVAEQREKDKAIQAEKEKNAPNPKQGGNRKSQGSFLSRKHKRRPGPKKVRGNCFGAWPSRPWIGPPPRRPCPHNHHFFFRRVRRTVPPPRSS